MYMEKHAVGFVWVCTRMSTYMSRIMLCHQIENTSWLYDTSWVGNWGRHFSFPFPHSSIHSFTHPFIHAFIHNSRCIDDSTIQIWTGNMTDYLRMELKWEMGILSHQGWLLPFDYELCVGEDDLCYLALWCNGNHGKTKIKLGWNYNIFNQRKSTLRGKFSDFEKVQ